MSDTLSSAFADTKPHYNILDGLRGGGGIDSCLFSLIRGLCYQPFGPEELITDIWLLIFSLFLSGFVGGYAYDDRWKTMRIADFLKRRFIRLHPMVIIGALIGAVMFYFQGCSVWGCYRCP